MGKKLDRRRRAEDNPATIEARKAGRVVTFIRRDALIQLIETAIELWFRGRDEISTHLLAMSAHQCLCDLGYSSFLKKAVGWVHFGLAYDWLHHVKSDPTDALDFSPKANGGIIYECCIGMGQIFGGSTVLMDAFSLYAALHLFPDNPNIREDATENLPGGLAVSEIEGLGVNDYLAKVMPVISAAKRRQG